MNVWARCVAPTEGRPIASAPLRGSALLTWSFSPRDRRRSNNAGPTCPGARLPGPGAGHELEPPGASREERKRSIDDLERDGSHCHGSGLRARLGSRSGSLPTRPCEFESSRTAFGLGRQRPASASRQPCRSEGARAAPATVPPAPAPASVAAADPLAPHEVFGFAPYWSLDQSAGFNVAGLTTLAYFSVGINANGSLNESGPGWNGYESQALSTLITRAHAAGKRVVLTVNDFDQHSLDALTSNPAAATTLSKALVGAIGAKSLDGVNLDLEGAGSADQAGLTALVTTVSDTLHFINPHWQVTMDTYASSAGDPGGFYDIPALAGVVDAFFVMEYSPNVAAPAQAASPLTSSLFSDLSTAAQYAAAVPAGKVILGTPLFGMIGRPRGTRSPTPRRARRRRSPTSR